MKSKTKSGGILGLLAFMAFSLCGNATAQTLNLGTVKFPNSGSPLAQEAFLDGFAALHCFWYPKALEKFREAEKIDPKFAMAYWGEAMTFNHPVWRQQDLEGAQSVLKRFGKTPQARAAQGKTKIEKALIRSLDLLYASTGTKAERDEKYSKYIKDLYKKYPNNVDMASFYALSILGTVKGYEGNYDKQLQAAQVMEDYLKIGSPDALRHPGLLHYLIHSYDHPQYAKRALKFANLYAKVSADSSHALHMPSHIFLQLGLWDKVAEQNEVSYQASVKWAKLDHKGQEYYEAYDFHSYYWLLYAYLQQGRYNDAKSLLLNMKKISDSDPSAHVQGYYGMMKARYAIETNQWDEVAIPSNEKEIQERLEGNLHAGCVGSESEHNRISSILSLGIGGARAGNLKVVSEAIESMNQLKVNYSTDGGGFDQKVLNIQQNLLKGLLEIAKGEKTQGLESLKNAADLEGLLDPPSGMPIPSKPAAELYAETLLQQNQAENALTWFKKSLARTPNRTLSVLGAYKASKKLGLELESKEYLRILKLNLIHADAAVQKSFID
jgi:hypothetical protein